MTPQIKWNDYINMVKNKEKKYIFTDFKSYFKDKVIKHSLFVQEGSNKLTECRSRNTHVSV